jgi:hypothetical protein
MLFLFVVIPLLALYFYPETVMSQGESKKASAPAVA